MEVVVVEEQGQHAHISGILERFSEQFNDSPKVHVYS